MEFDWNQFTEKDLPTKEVEESFEDPFSLKFLPDSDYGQKEARYFNLGKSLENRAIFSLFWTNGKRYRVLVAREMTPDELAFYQRKNAESLL